MKPGVGIEADVLASLRVDKMSAATQIKSSKDEA